MSLICNEWGVVDHDGVQSIEDHINEVLTAHAKPLLGQIDPVDAQVLEMYLIRSITCWFSEYRLLQAVERAKAREAEHNREMAYRVLE